MSPLLAGFAYVSLFATMSSGEKPRALSDKDILEIKMKILDLRDKISNLSKQEEALLKQLDHARKITNNADEPYVKVEVKGTLKEIIPSGNTARYPPWWVIDAGGSRINGNSRSWVLDFGAQKDLLELAKKQKGRTVLITGQLVLQRSGSAIIGEELVLVVATLMALGQ